MTSYPCDVCGRVFKTQNGQLNHERTAHDVPTQIARNVAESSLSMQAEALWRAHCFLRDFKPAGMTPRQEDELRMATDICSTSYITIAGIRNRVLRNG